jgi:hypothetical protein
VTGNLSDRAKQVACKSGCWYTHDPNTVVNIGTLLSVGCMASASRRHNGNTLTWKWRNWD